MALILMRNGIQIGSAGNGGRFVSWKEVIQKVDEGSKLDSHGRMYGKDTSPVLVGTSEEGYSKAVAWWAGYRDDAMLIIAGTFEGEPISPMLFMFDEDDPDFIR